MPFQGWNLGPSKRNLPVPIHPRDMAMARTVLSVFTTPLQSCRTPQVNRLSSCKRTTQTKLPAHRGTGLVFYRGTPTTRFWLEGRTSFLHVVKGKPLFLSVSGAAGGPSLSLFNFKKRSLNEQLVRSIFLLACVFSAGPLWRVGKDSPVASFHLIGLV